MKQTTEKWRIWKWQSALEITKIYIKSNNNETIRRWKTDQKEDEK